MFRETIPCHLTVMVRVENEERQVLAVDRVKSWQGLTFPGGHVEAQESFFDCARREVEEETGIRITDLSLTGVIHWSNRDQAERYLVLCIRARAAGGALKDSSEGRALWLSSADLLTAALSPGFAGQLALFEPGGPWEAFGTFGEGGDSDLTYDKGR